MQENKETSCTVSIVLPTYNAALFLAEAIDSVLAQSFTDWELIIVEDGSTDSTAQIATEYALADKRILVHQLDENCGAPARPRNIGVSLAKGEWVALLDADDLWHPEKLKHQFAALARHGGNFSCTGMKNFTQTAEIDFFDFETSAISHIGYVRQRFRTAIPNSGVLIKRNLLEAHSFNEDRRLVEDFHCWLRVLRSGETCLKLNAPYVAYRVTPGQFSERKLRQARKVFNVHQSLPIWGPLSFIPSTIFTGTHLLGAFFSRVLLKRM